MNSIWTDEGNGGTSGDTLVGTMITAGTVNNFSPFTLASTDAKNPLPIDLLSFDSEWTDGVVNLDWVTSTELRNDFFTVERSLDLIFFETVVTVPGAGNSNVELSYSSIDETPYSGTSYYRLKQTDYNGEHS